MTFYSVVLLVVFYLLVLAEFFLPTGGVLGFGATAALIAAVWIGFSHSFGFGLAVLTFVLLTTPPVLIGMVRAYPHTPIGRRMLNRRPGEASQPPTRKTSRGTPIEELVGRTGVAETDLLPSGRVVLDGEKMDAVSTGMPIDAGNQVIVTSVEVGRLHVRAVTDQDLADKHASPPQSPPSLESFDLE